LPENSAKSNGDEVDYLKVFEAILGGPAHSWEDDMTFRLKAENFAIAAGLILLYVMLPALSYDIRLSLAPKLAKQHDNSWLVKFDLETELLDNARQKDDLEIGKNSVVVENPAAVERPVLPVRASSRYKTYLPFLASSNTKAVAAEVEVVEPAAVETVIQPEAPVRIVIPAIKLDAPVVPAKTRVIRMDGGKYRQWMVPNQFAAGWHKNTARLGESGNTVINGHHNVYGEVFRRLVKLEPGDLIQIYSETKVYEYIVTNKMILPETFQELDVRMENAQWILPSDDERITLITCWPYESNTHRLVIVARPLQ
jgi:LPXTG-site transpeptidase (sortase) family protein